MCRWDDTQLFIGSYCNSYAVIRITPPLDTSPFNELTKPLYPLNITILACYVHRFYHIYILHCHGNTRVHIFSPRPTISELKKLLKFTRITCDRTTIRNQINRVQTCQKEVPQNDIRLLKKLYTN